MVETFVKLSPEDQQKLYDCPIWITLLAAYDNDGKVNREEKVRAIKLAHMRTYTAPPLLQNFYKDIDENFEARIEFWANELPEELESKKEYLRAKLVDALDLLPQLDFDWAKYFTDSLESFYRHVFRSAEHFLQYFMLPVISARLDKIIARDHLTAKDGE